MLELQVAHYHAQTLVPFISIVLFDSSLFRCC
jgi:hypothetical protein